MLFRAMDGNNLIQVIEIEWYDSCRSFETFVHLMKTASIKDSYKQSVTVATAETQMARIESVNPDTFAKMR
jgi:hypothetical protein